MIFRLRLRPLRRTSKITVPLSLLVALVTSGCAPKRTTANVPPAPQPAPSNTTPPNTKPPRAVPPNAGQPNKNNKLGPIAPGGYAEQGIASWYGLPFHGRQAANGEIYDMHKFTAAHRTLPFNTVVRVTSLVNGEHVDVRITDRGPFVGDRVIDLSLAAASAIDMVGSGTARVRLEIVNAPTNPAKGSFGVQVGAFSDRKNAERLRDQLSSRYQTISIQEGIGPNGRLFRLRIGNEPSEDAARKLASKLHSEDGFETFVVRLDDAQQTSSPD